MKLMDEVCWSFYSGSLKKKKAEEKKIVHTADSISERGDGKLCVHSAGFHLCAKMREHTYTGL